MQWSEFRSVRGMQEANGKRSLIRYEVSDSRYPASFFFLFSFLFSPSLKENVTFNKFSKMGPFMGLEVIVPQVVLIELSVRRSRDCPDSPLVFSFGKVMWRTCQKGYLASDLLSYRDGSLLFLYVQCIHLCITIQS
ncbi:hypothetical protein BDV23DRAFT_56317 [Aspergillus alliaceus]|uniref:Uncharacterized protein n=1 Tax=Petromyces alliaceus TaxID=209559 RepID=A0A5N7CDL2_PETAA|nr:hypothetical protein BDV23DRAFT_56317 [Aspergillus alliaceus]